MILETLPALGALTVDQKLRLVWELWQDISRDVILTPETAELLDDHAANPNCTRTTDEVTASILVLKQRIAASRA